MSTVTTSVVVPHLRVAPRGAQLVGLLYDALNRFTAWRHTRAQARRRLARAKEAEAVRQLAHDLQASDPGFASDLYAAADRHWS